MVIERDTTGPLEVVWLSNGLLSLGFVPALGGRLLSLRRGTTEVLWRNGSLLDNALHPIGGHVPSPASGAMGDWVNYGGDKTWPAPQGWGGAHQWTGPPDPVLDSGPYTVDCAGGSVTLTSGADPRTGLRLRRRFVLSPEEISYRLELTATNVSARPVRWALWNVTQLPAGAVRVGLADRAEPRVVELIAATGPVRFQRESTGEIVVPGQDAVGKLGFPGSAGWVTHVGAEVSLTQRFDVVEGAEYPDSGSPLEVWLESPVPEPLAGWGGLNPPDRIVECEVLGPLTALAPGASTTLAITFSL